MKRFFILALSLSVALLQTGRAEQPKKRAAAHAVPAVHALGNVHRNISVQRNFSRSANVHRNVSVQRNFSRPTYRGSVNRSTLAHNALKSHVVKNTGAVHTAALSKQRNVAIRNRNTAALNANAQINRNRRQTIITNRQNQVVRQSNVVIRNRNSFAEASRRFNWRQRHDRGWWRENWGNSSFVIFGGGYYFWNSGYWYPAYGYDPAYSTYQYDEPIYGYNQLPPDQVIANTQTQLQREGYYNGAIDGRIGPMTRYALERYQADHGLIVTRSVDEPTLESLGLA